jgi:hypothetical protein
MSVKWPLKSEFANLVNNHQREQISVGNILQALFLSSGIKSLAKIRSRTPSFWFQRTYFNGN